MSRDKENEWGGKRIVTLPHFYRKVTDFINQYYHKGYVTIIVTVKKSVLLLSNAEFRSISVVLPTSKGTIEFQVLPVDRKNSFTFKLFTEDREVAWCIGMTDMTVILWAVLVTMPSGMTVMTDEVIVRVGGYDGDVGH
jgi:hypothetical protein